MVYTDGEYLLADTINELHRVARRLQIPYCLFQTSPFPCYRLEGDYQQLVDKQKIKYTAPAKFVRPLPST